MSRGFGSATSALLLRCAWLLCLCIELVGCGARSGLDVSVAGDAGPAPNPEECNGADEDGDGFVDEGLGTIACGTGACENEVPACVDGLPPECTPLPPSDEQCDGRDNDCDSFVDEELGFGPVGPPIIIRSSDELGDDRCSTCRTAFGPTLAASDGSIVAMWRLGFLGTDPIPNTFARVLSLDGTPRSATRLIFERNTTRGLNAVTGGVGRVAAVFCGRYGADDVAASALLGPDAALVSEQPRQPDDRSCGASNPDVIWTGERYLFAWTDNSSGPVEGFEVLFDIADADGESLEWRTLHPEGELRAPPRMAVGHGRVGLVTGLFEDEPRRSRLAFHLFESDGTEVGEPLFIDPPEGLDDLFSRAFVEATADGWLVQAVFAFDVPGRLVASIDADGAVVRDVRRLEAESDYVRDIDDLLRTEDGRFVMAGPVRMDGDYRYRVARLDMNGVVEAAWESDPVEEPGFGDGALLEVGGRVLIVYTLPVSAASYANEVRIRAFGCVP